MNGGALDAAVRTAAFAFLVEQRHVYGQQLPRSVLASGFDFQGRRVPLIGPQGIFKPAVIPDIPLSITTAPEVTGKPRPYEDEQLEDGQIVYRFRGTDPDHRDNVGLRRAMHEQAPLVYFSGVDIGWYVPIFPAYVVAENRGECGIHCSGGRS